MKRLCKWSLIVGCVAVAAWTIWNLWATSRLERVVGELRERGLPTTIADLEAGLPPFDSEPAGTENAAPILNAAFALVKSIGPLPDWDLRESPELPEGVREGLPRFAEVFDLLYRAAERPRCRFDLRWSDGWEMLLAHLSAIRDLSRLLQTRAVARTADGDVEGAIEDVRVIFALSRCLREEPILISQLVRIAVADMGLEALREILPRSQSAVEALDETSPDPAAGSMACALQGELVMALWFATGEYRPEVLEILAPRGGLGVVMSSGLVAPYVRADVAFLGDLLARCIETARMPYPTALELIDGVMNEAPQGGAVTAMVFPAVSKAIEQEARHASRVALARLSARCIDHKRKQGEYPSRLDELKDVEPDPLTGRPFVLEARPAGILVRSEAHEDTADREIAWELGG